MLAALLLGLTLTQSVVTNGSFELAKENRVDGWRTQTWAGRANFQRDTIAKTGQASVSIESPEGIDGGWQTTLQVQPYSKYRISAWVKTQDVANLDGQGAVLNLHSRPEHTKAIAGTQDWTQVAFEVETGADDALVLNCLLGYYGRSKGKAWFDDVEVTLLATRKIDPKATIDVTQKFEPISKYIYAQFIEHMGKCIYGGIWAEMLEDRKFFYAVGTEPSPWYSPSGQVTMDKKDAFSGEHSAVVGDSIAQGDLWIEKGRDYVGYAWVRGIDANRKITVSLGSSSRSRAARMDFGSAVTQNALTSGWTQVHFKFKATETSRNAELLISGDGKFRAGAVSVMPADNIRGMRKDTVALLKELNAPLYRWPGGNFVSGYEWRDGIGDRDRRPTRKNPAWQGIDSNDFGTHEFLDFCKEINTEPLIVVNTGFGDATSAAAWLQYVNGPAQTEEGARRARDGRKDPWAVKWWGIGNEMYGPWQLGHIPVDQYIVKHNMVYDRMMKVDPLINTIASSDLGGDWSKKMLENCPMTLISEHFYCQEKASVPAHVAQIPNAIRSKVAAHRKLRDTIPGLKEKGIKIAMDEWNYWYGDHVFGELGTRYFVKDGLGIAAGLHEYYRSSDMVGMAQYAQTVNVIGCIKTNPINAAFETTGLVLKLYRQEFGVIPVAVTGSAEPLDVMAALTADGKALTFSVVNPTARAVTLPLTWQGANIADSGKRWEIADPDPMAYNDPEAPNRIQIKESTVSGLKTGIEVKPYSSTLVRVDLR